MPVPVSLSTAGRRSSSSSSSLTRPGGERRVSGSSVSTAASAGASGMNMVADGLRGDENGRRLSGSGSANGMINPQSGLGKMGARPYGRSVSARELSVGVAGEPGLRVRSGSGSAGSGSGSASGSGSGAARIGENIVRPRSVSGDGSLGQAYVPPLSRAVQVGPGLAGAYQYGPGIPQGYAPAGYAQVTSDGMLVQPLQPQPRHLAAQGYVLYPADGGSGLASSSSASTARSGYWVEQANGQHYYHPAGPQDEVNSANPGHHQMVEYGYPAQGVSYTSSNTVFAQPQAVHYYHPAAGYPNTAPAPMVDNRGFVIPDRSHSVSRTSSRSTGGVRYRQSEGEGRALTEEGDDAVSVQSSNSAAFTARILAGMGGVAAAATSGERERRDSMGDRLTVPKPEKGRKSKNKDKKKREDDEEAEAQQKGTSRKPVSAASSAATGLSGSAADGDSDGGSRPTAWRPDLRPGDTVTDPNYPTAHGCPYCDKVYTGQHARSICRRHQMSKHGIELEVQVKKSRWDNSE